MWPSFGRGGAHVLIGLPTSPLRKALLDSRLGEDLAGGGLEDELRQMTFSTGLKGIRPGDAQTVEELIFATLAELVRTGLPADAVEAGVNALEFALRENNTGSFPRGLALMTFELTADAVNVDKYLPAAQARPKEAVPGDAKIVASKSVLATSTARVQGHIKVDRLTARGLALTDLDIAVAAADGLVTVSPVSFGLSGGSVHGGMTVALARPVPAWTLNAAVSGVEVKPVLTALTGKAALSGAFSAKAAVATTGTTGKELLSGLAGPVSLRLDHGQVEGFSVSPQLLASLKGLVGLVKLDPQGLVQAVSGFGQAMFTPRIV